MRHVGSNVLALRLSYGWSQRKLGRVSRLGRAAVTRIEGFHREGYNPNLRTITRLARAFSLEPYDILLDARGLSERYGHPSEDILLPQEIARETKGLAPSRRLSLSILAGIHLGRRAMKLALQNTQYNDRSTSRMAR